MLACELVDCCRFCRVANQLVCRRAFQLINRIRSETLTAIIKAVKEETEYSRPDKRRRTSGVDEPYTDLQKAVHDAVSEIVEFLGENMPHLSRKNKKGELDLPVILLPSSLYPKKTDLLADLIARTKLPSEVKIQFFRKLWRRYFPNVLLKSWSPFAKCDVCTKFRSQLLKLSRNEDREALRPVKEAQKNHRDLVKFSRERFTDREQLARDHPDDFLYIIIDGMDCKKAQSPRFRSDATFCKDLEGTGNPLKSKLTGALLPGRGFMNFWSLPRHPHDPNFTATILLRTLVEVSNSFIVM